MTTPEQDQPTAKPNAPRADGETAATSDEPTTASAPAEAPAAGEGAATAGENGAAAAAAAGDAGEGLPSEGPLRPLWVAYGIVTAAFVLIWVLAWNLLVAPARQEAQNVWDATDGLGSEMRGGSPNDTAGAGGPTAPSDRPQREPESGTQPEPGRDATPDTTEAGSATPDGDSD